MDTASAPIADRPVFLLGVCIPAVAILLLTNAAPALAQAEPGTITELGRLEPKGGVIRVAGPSHAAVVISELSVDRGRRARGGS
jgi:hypothetical protein